MALWCFTADDYTDGSADVGGETVWVWPDNVAAVNTFVAMGTQWRVGPGGAYGLDYGALPQVLRLVGIARAEWPRVFDEIRVLEDAALEAMRKE